MDSAMETEIQVSMQSIVGVGLGFFNVNASCF